MAVEGVSTCLSTCVGACVGAQLSLSAETLPFGTVVLGSSATKRLQIDNTGDVGCQFVWDAAALGSHFSIHPMSAFIAPGSNLKVDVTFHPKEVSADLRVDKLPLRATGDAACHVTLTGACAEVAPHPDAVEFACPVRGSDKRAVKLTNPSVTTWQLKPVV